MRSVSRPAISAVLFVAALVDRQQGGRQNIEKLGYSVVSAFVRDDLVGPQGEAAQVSAGKP